MNSADFRTHIVTRLSQIDADMAVLSREKSALQIVLETLPQPIPQPSPQPVVAEPVVVAPTVVTQRERTEKVTVTTTTQTSPGQISEALANLPPHRLAAYHAMPKSFTRQTMTAWYQKNPYGLSMEPGALHSRVQDTLTNLRKIRAITSNEYGTYSKVKL